MKIFIAYVLNKKKIIYAVLLSVAICICVSGCADNGESKQEETQEEQFREIHSKKVQSNEEQPGEEIEADQNGDNDNTGNIGNTGNTGNNVSGSAISFETVDINGNTVTEDIFKDSKIVILNLWEPWCGPCVNEMPDLNYLYETYKDQGLLVVGAYATEGMDSEAKAVVDECGVTYPIIKVDDNLMQLEQDYVPATFIVDNNGNLMDEEPIAGSRSYEEWEMIVTSYLQ